MIIARNLPCLHLLLLMLTYTWVWGGTRSDMLLYVVPWSFMFLLEAMIFFPQRRSTETITEARERVWRHLARDPLTYLSIFFMILLVLPLFNVSSCWHCPTSWLAERTARGVHWHLTDEWTDAVLPQWLPFCMNRYHQLNVIIWFVPILTAVSMTKHCLLKRGKRVLIEMFVWNATALGVLGFVQQMAGAEYPLWYLPPIHFLENMGLREAPSWWTQPFSDFFSTWGYPNMAADYFTFMFAVSVGLWHWRFMEEVNKDNSRHRHLHSASKNRHRILRANYMLFAVVVNFFAALATKSRSAILLSGLLAVLLAIYIFVAHFTRLTGAKRVKLTVTSTVACIFVAGGLFIAAPKSYFTELQNTSLQQIADRLTGRTQYHVRVAFEIASEHPVFGCGGWGYQHLNVYPKDIHAPKYESKYLTKEDLKNFQVTGGANIHNDFVQFICEHGYLGFAVLTGIFLCIIIPLAKSWHVLHKSAQFSLTAKTLPHPQIIYCLPAPVLCIFLGAGATFVHAFADCPLRSPAVLMTLLTSLVCADGFLPRIRN